MPIAQDKNAADKKLNACVNAQIESELKPLIVFKTAKKAQWGIRRNIS